MALPTSRNGGTADKATLKDADPGRPHDWAARTADTIDELLGKVRSKTTVPLERLTRILVYGIVAVTLGVVVVVLVIIALVRALDELIPGPVWSAYLILGGIFLAVGLFLWRKRPSRQDG
ncbi:MAG TPA: phage holin family protein [Acidimicrobiales bacterium]